MAQFLIRLHDGAESTYEITKAETRIGRVEPLVDLAIPDQMASRIHAVVRKLQSGFTLVDLRSANHTFVNGEETPERRLREGDVIRIGQTTLVFQASREVTRAGGPAAARGFRSYEDPVTEVTRPQGCRPEGDYRCAGGCSIDRSK